MRRLLSLGSLLLPLLVLSACATVAFYALFSNFRTYDDEGLFLMASRLFLGGEAFYTEIPWTYGPVYLFIVQLLHDWLEIPMTHSAVRFVTLVSWLVLAGISGFLVNRLVHSRQWAMISAILVFLFARSVVNEPGHPQVLVAIATLLLPVLACSAQAEKRWLPWFMMGVCTAIVLNIKMNAGVFCVAAISVVLLSRVRSGRWSKRLHFAAVAGSFFFPFILMLPFLSEANCLLFAAIVALSSAGVAAVLSAQENPTIDVSRASLAFTAAVVLITLLALLYAAFKGATVIDIVESLLSYSASQLKFYHFFRDYSVLQLILAVFAAGLALRVARAQNPASGWWLCLGKACLVAAAAYALLIDNPGNSQAMLGYAAPWCWAVAINSIGQDRAPGRLVLAATAVWAPLLAYPIPGSQLYLGSFMVLLAAVVCCADLLAMTVPKWQSQKASALRAMLGPLLLTTALILLYSEYVTVRTQYERFRPLALPGTEYMRIEPRRGQHFRALVDTLDQADVTLITFRFNSLYLWSRTTTPVSGYLPYYPIAYAAAVEQDRLITGLQKARSPLVVRRNLSHEAVEKNAIAQWLESHYEESAKIGPYTLMNRRSK
jgi:hypothetical protein